ncbi:AMP-binding protein [Jatrophihabitans telluris]|uniref:AMP-binding protein n=1 Tax=Jatrophihabitans telluris TaxID=2038343 RepID=A0ABY4QXL9_9ACTN|nr:AMP-binding protein [Jatrophihabitans telluris]UQX88285.1 AMP-binding protein [Jatrophihabitans telluris]
MTAANLPSYASGTSTTPLLGDTIGENLARTAARFADRTAVVECASGRRLRYAEFDAAVDGLSRGLVALGLQAGDRAGIWAPNGIDWMLVQYATARVGVILVTINPAYRSHELGYVLAQSGVAVLFSAVTHKGSDYRAMVDEVAGDCPDLKHVVYLGESSWDEVVAAGQAVPIEIVRGIAAGLDPDDPINIQYTSGTTGFPKGATLTHHNILNNGYFVGELCHYTERDVVCVPVPFYHCFGMVMGNLASTTHGACLVIPAPGFDPADTLRAVQQERCTSLYGVPTMFIAELSLPDFADYDLSSLRTGIMAGSPCPTEVMKRVVADMGMTEVTICYGMTETSPVSTQTRIGDTLEQQTGTVGRVHPHVQVKVIDPATGRIVPRGTTGELCTRAYSVMRGYWQQPDKTAEVLVNGWMHTGDLAVMDAEGYLSIVGRSKDMVIRGGENVYPREVEEFLYQHADIEDVQVVGVPDERYGEELLAAIRVRAGSQLSEQDVRDFCRGRLAHFKVPRYVQFVDEYPMTVTGKVQKYRIRDAAVQRLGL